MPTPPGMLGPNRGGMAVNAALGPLASRPALGGDGRQREDWRRKSATERPESPASGFARIREHAGRRLTGERPATTRSNDLY